MSKHLKFAAISVIISILFLGFTGCSGESAQDAEKIADGMLSSFKQLDLVSAKAYLTEEITTSQNKDTLVGDTDFLMMTLFDRLTYEIISSEKVDSNTATVKVKITAINIEPVMNDFLSKYMQEEFSNINDDTKTSAADSKKRSEEIFAEMATKPNLKTVTNEIDITVIKSDDGWKVKTDKKLINALFGGLLEMTNQMEETTLVGK